MTFYDLCFIQVLQDNAKSRRELGLHWKAGACPFIVKIKEVYENKFMKRDSLLAVMEWYAFVLFNCINYDHITRYIIFYVIVIKGN